MQQPLSLTAHVIDGPLVGSQELPTLVEQELKHRVVIAHLHHTQVVVIRI